MKKNKIFIIASIAALFSVTALIVGCDIFGTFNSVAIGPKTNFAFNGRSLGRSVASRAVDSNARAALPGTTTDAASFASLNSFYSGLGALQATTITPTEFSLNLARANTLYKGDYFLLIDPAFREFGYSAQYTSNEVKFRLGIAVNFAGNVTLATDWPIPAGAAADEIIIQFHPNDTFSSGEVPTPNPRPTSASEAKSKITFRVPEGVTNPSWTAVNVAGGVYAWDATTRMVTVAASLLMPGTAMDSDLEFHYKGNTYKLEWSRLTIPMLDPIVVPKNVSSVTISMYWDLNGIIEQYGTGASATFVLANKFWERLDIRATFN
jgi:hypothetical protein